MAKDANRTSVAKIGKLDEDEEDEHGYMIYTADCAHCKKKNRYYEPDVDAKCCVCMKVRGKWAMHECVNPACKDIYKICDKCLSNSEGRHYCQCCEAGPFCFSCMQQCRQCTREDTRNVCLRCAVKCDICGRFVCKQCRTHCKQCNESFCGSKCFSKHEHKADRKRKQTAAWQALFQRTQKAKT